MRLVITTYQRLLTAMSLLLLIGLTSCGPAQVTGGGSASCAAGQAQILVQDGFFRNLCGCQESQGQFIQAGQPLNCTVQTGTTVMFLFNGTQNAHQIVTTTGQALTWVVNGSGGRSPNEPAIFPLTAPGTIPFHDMFNNTMTGAFIVL